MKKTKLLIVVTSVYLLMSVLFTWPLVAKISTNGFGHDEDAPYHIWHNWWFKYSIFDLKQNPLHTNYIFHPQNINLIYDANAFVFSALTLPIQLLTKNVVLASNVIFLFSFALSGLFSFLLADYVLKSRPQALMCGFIFAFNPYVLAQAIDGHINLTSTWLIPIYTLFLIKILGSERIQVKLSVLAGLAATFQFYNDFTYTSFLIVETVLISAFYFYESLLKNKKIEMLKRYILSGLVIGAVALVLGSPIIYEVVKASKEGFRVGSPTWVQNVWSADLLTFIRPNDQTTFLKNPWTPNIGTVEGTAFLGYSVIVLTALYLILRVVKKYQVTKEENLMVLLAVVFFLLMLGPSLHYENKFQFDLYGAPFIFPLPYLLLHKIPFVGETQEPGRMLPFLILPLSILVSLGVSRLFELFSVRIFIRHLILASLFLLLIFEYLPLPFPTTDLSPKPVFETIRKDPENRAVLVLPLGFNSGNYSLGHSPIGSLQFYQAYFQKPSFRGTVARLPYSVFEYYQKLPLLPYLIDPKSELKNGDFDKANDLKIFKDQLNIKYIVVMEDKYKGPMGRTYEILEKFLGAKKFYDQNLVRGYSLE